MQNLYKAYQLAAYFCIKFKYHNLFLKGLKKDDELFVYNAESNRFQIIHITLADLSLNMDNDDRVRAICEGFMKQFKLNEVEVLEIHISKETVTRKYSSNIICMEEDYYSGVDVSEIFPEIKTIIHHVKNPNDEIKKCVDDINKDIKKQRSARLIKPLKGAYISIGVFALCLIVAFLTLIITDAGFSSSAAYIFLGASYRTFNLGLNQFWRFLTYGFVHGGVAHLFCNLYSLFVIGPLIEREYGKTKYAIILFGSIICGGLCHGCLTENGLCLGLSGGLYGLLVIYIMNVLKNFDGKLPVSFLYVVLLNLIINILPGISWQGHLGGAIFGFICYYMFKDDRVDIKFAAIAIVVLSVLGFKYYSNPQVNPLYVITDSEVVSIKKKYISEESANKLKSELVELYNKEGAIYYE